MIKLIHKINNILILFLLLILLTNPLTAGPNEDFISAISSGNISEIEKTLKSGANINSQDKYLRNAIIIAIANCGPNYLKVCHLLITKGIDLNSPDYRGNTALKVACQKGDIDAVKLLCNSGASIDLKDEKHKRSPLLWSLYFGKYEIAKYLITKGADVNTYDNDGMTPLLGASAKGQLDIIKLLIEKGAKVNAKDKNGKSAIDYSYDENIKSYFKSIK